MDFTVIDVESANADPASICQIGLALVRGGRVVEIVSQYIDPRAPFADFNIGLTGISPETVRGQPDFAAWHPELAGFLGENLIVSHSYYDRTAIGRACERAGLAAPAAQWLDSIRAARAAWPGRKGGAGYGLAGLARDLGLSFRHHDAGEDARVAAEMVLRAAQETGARPEDWLPAPGAKPRRSAAPFRPAPDPRGPAFGHSIAFTGTLALSRRSAALRAAALGFTVTDRIGANTDLLVHGTRSGGIGESAKLREARALIGSGARLRILDEEGFMALLAAHPEPQP